MIEFIINKEAPYIGITVDVAYLIKRNDEIIGHVYLNKMSDGDLFIEWIEFNEEYKGKHYLRKVLMDLMDFLSVSEICFEANEELLPMYKHIGAIINDYIEFRDMYTLHIRKENLYDKCTSV